MLNGVASHLSRALRRGAYLAFASTCLLAHCRAFGLEVCWPTPNDGFSRGLPPEEVLQPTAGGKPLSGAFGDVRSGGYKFHEGIDIRPVKRSRKGEPLDEIFCMANGRVAMINRIAGNSGYGRYVVVTHQSADIEIYTLYAHLSEISPDISIGSRVSAGTVLGKMGRSASYRIARAQAHLHFEIGLRLSDGFDRWYSAQKYTQPNRFGNWNGLNLVGFDPWDFFVKAKSGALANGIAAYLDAIPTAFVARIYTSKTPDFAGIYPELVDKSGDDCGWDIHFTWYGLPKKLERIKNPKKNPREGELEIISYNPSEIGRKCRRMISVSEEGEARATEDFKDLLRKLFP